MIAVGRRASVSLFAKLVYAERAENELSRSWGTK
jgi:hypothetical protein